jgi:DNA-binding response OmpR family regulator
MKKILIVEDDIRIASALEIRLNKHGYTTVVAHDAIQATHSAVTDRPDLILLDIALPGGNGFELAAKFKQTPGIRRVPFIFMTASKDPRLRAKAMDLYAAGLLEKPYDGEELISLVRFALGETTTFRAPAPTVVLDPPATIRKKILIIEDDERAATALGLRMRHAGYDPTSAYDAVSGVQAAARCHPDLVLLDIAMPGGNGFTTAERIQKLAPMPIPFIFITGSKQPFLRAQAEEMGAAGFFEKPYDPQALLSTVHRTLATANSQS